MTGDEAFEAICESVKEFVNYVNSPNREKYVDLWTKRACTDPSTVVIWLNALLTHPTIEVMDLDAPLRVLNLNKAPYSSCPEVLIDIVTQSPLNKILKYSASDHNLTHRTDLDRDLHHRVVLYARSLQHGHAD